MDSSERKSRPAVHWNGTWALVVADVERVNSVLVERCAPAEGSSRENED